ncbi:MAG: tripartite tricarboxylate transporter TctB family protein [Deltaproteobacteria bacterium]|nr:tripartite tricarboxylate transporter TctB family protein [Deltaproteobacteria bacterium]
MAWLNRISSLFLIGFSLLIIVASRRLGIGSLQEPGPGFMGFLAAIALLCLSLLVAGKDLAASLKKRAGQTPLRWEELRRPLVLIVALGAYVAGLDFLGYLVATSLLVFVMLFFYEPGRWPVHIVVALVMVNASYLLFYKWLGVLLPRGALHAAW